MLVGNKKDIRDDTSDKLRLHFTFCLNKMDGLEMSYHIGAFEYLECSAKMNDGVKEVFDTVIEGPNHVLF